MKALKSTYYTKHKSEVVKYQNRNMYNIYI